MFLGIVFHLHLELCVSLTVFRFSYSQSRSYLSTAASGMAVLRFAQNNHSCVLDQGKITRRTSITDFECFVAFRGSLSGACWPGKNCVGILRLCC